MHILEGVDNALSIGIKGVEPTGVNRRGSNLDFDLNPIRTDGGQILTLILIQSTDGGQILTLILIQSEPKEPKGVKS